MSEPTITMKMRRRLVTLPEAQKSTQRLVNSHFRNAETARVSIPVNVNDDDVVACDYLHQQTMSAEELVMFLRPDAEFYGGGHGKVWIQGNHGEMLSDVCYLGTSEARRAAAWASAVKELEQGV